MIKDFLKYADKTSLVAEMLLRRHLLIFRGIILVVVLTFIQCVDWITSHPDPSPQDAVLVGAIGAVLAKMMDYYLKAREENETPAEIADKADV